MSEEIQVLNQKIDFLTEQVVSVTSRLKTFDEFKEDVGPLAKEMFNHLVDKFEQLEKDGLFTSLQSMMAGMKRLHDNFTSEQIERMGDNHVKLLKLSNRLATPENLEKLEKIADEIQKVDFKKREKVSLFKVLKKARNPEVLRSIDLVLDIAAIVAKQNQKA